MKRMMELGKSTFQNKKYFYTDKLSTMISDYIVTSRFYHESFYKKTYSTKEVLQCIESAKETVCKR